MLDRNKVLEIYAEAADLPESQRSAFLDRACAGDPSLRAEVESLLSAASRRPGFLGAPTTNVPPKEAELAGMQIGPYKLLQEIGHGGFGSVYLAEQETPVRRRVALKIIKLGMDTRAVIARFEAERQALAMMDHAHIAKVLDAGATASGRPFFVMELVRGEPITRYADQANLSIAERLNLFIQVCQAVQHAHSKGVIHRDIKPANILVATQDGRPHAKVIDFGIAKATDHRLTAKTLFTEFRQLVGTPEYMSPEQAGARPDVDTRSDIYSLGVLLYELLTGATPFDPTTLRAAAYDEIQRIIREVEPPKPSTRLSRLASLANIAALRHTEPARLSALITGDLDWIAMKALDKDRGRRYETASALAADIQRHLTGEPVAAAPPSTAYRFRKFVRRNRVSVVGVAAVAFALILGVLGTSIGLFQAYAARDDEKTHRIAAQASAARAEAEAARATRAEADAKARSAELERVAEFQQVQLGSIDAQAMGLRLRADLLSRVRQAGERSGLTTSEVDTRVAELDRLIAGSDFTGLALSALEESVLRPALGAVAARFGDQPLVKARLLQTLADTLRDLGLQEAARAPQEEALAIRRRELGADHTDTITSINNAGILAMRSGRREEAEKLLREAVAGRRRVNGETDPLTLTTMNNLGTLLVARRQFDEARALFSAVLEERRRALGDEHVDTLISIHNMGHLLNSQGRSAEAIEYYRDVVDRRTRILGKEHRDTLTSMSNLAMALQAEGQLSQAEAMHREVLERRRRLLGDDHPHTLMSISNLGLALHKLKKLDEAARCYREAIERQRRVYGARTTATLTSMSNLGHLLVEDGHASEAEVLLREALSGLRLVAGEESPNTLLSMIGLAKVLNGSERFAETVALLNPAESGARRVLINSNAVHLGTFLTFLGRARMATGDFDAAEASFTEAYSILNQARGPGPKAPVQGLADLFEARHRLEPTRGFDIRRDEWRAKLEGAAPPAEPR